MAKLLLDDDSIDPFVRLTLVKDGANVHLEGESHGIVNKLLTVFPDGSIKRWSMDHDFIEVTRFSVNSANRILDSTI